jgi:hypothetical protein
MSADAEMQPQPLDDGLAARERRESQREPEKERERERERERTRERDSAADLLIRTACAHSLAALSHGHIQSYKQTGIARLAQAISLSN